MFTKYTVIVEKFAERHYIKRFSKKYGRAWDITCEALMRQFQSFEVLIRNEITNIILGSELIKICKHDFKIAGTNESRRSSGNRCILAWHKDKGAVHVLLVYGKTDIGSGKETTAWKNIIRENYPRYRDLL